MAPLAPHAFSMTFERGLFAHWPVDPATIRPAVPAPLELDTYEGRAWVTVVPFVLARAGFRWTPSLARVTVPECNVRTYVRFDGEPGLYFFSVDVGSRAIAAVVRAATRLPCYHADVDVRALDGRVTFRSVRRTADCPRARFEASYGPDGDAVRAARGTLDHWLVERRRMYDPSGPGVLYAEIAHEPWPLQPADATIDAAELFRASDLPHPEGEPRLHYAHGVPITGSTFRRIRGLDRNAGIRPPELASRP